MLCILLGRACLFTFGMLPHLSGKCICGTSSSAEYVGWAHIKFAKIFSVTANKLIFVTVQFTVGSQCEAGRHEQSGARRRRRRGAAPVLCRALRENSLHPTQRSGRFNNELPGTRRIGAEVNSSLRWWNVHQ